MLAGRDEVQTGLGDTLKTLPKLALAALFAVAFTASAQAKTVNYVFGQSGGGAFCDGLSLKEINGIATGIHTGDADCTEGQYAGGLKGVLGQINTPGGKNGPTYSIVTRETGSPNSQELFVIDQQNMTWVLYMQTTGSAQFTDVTSGPLLLAGSPASRSGMSAAVAAQASITRAHPPQNPTVEFTLADGTGAPFCNGVSLSESGGIAAGSQTGCDNSAAGGVYGRFVNEGARRWAIVTSSNVVPALDFIYVLDQKKKTWTLYQQYSGLITFQYSQSGVLLDGPPPPSARRRSVLSTIKH